MGCFFSVERIVVTITETRLCKAPFFLKRKRNLTHLKRIVHGIESCSSRGSLRGLFHVLILAFREELRHASVATKDASTVSYISLLVHDVRGGEGDDNLIVRTTTFSLACQCGHLEHRVVQKSLQEAAKPSRTRPLRLGKLRNRAQRSAGHAQPGVIHRKQRRVLLQQSVARFREAENKLVDSQLCQSAMHRESSHEFGNQPEAHEILRLHASQEVVLFRNVRSARRTESDGRARRAFRHRIREVNERATADEKDVSRVHGDRLPARRLASPLVGNVDDRSLDHLQERLLHALAAHVARHAAARALARHLVDLVDVHDSSLREAHVEVGSLQ
mmetsp:Transcript_3385/g.9125  ORF Transcript_3385/g.9125 Transcript_3385/m.9125 type:complete len:332 (-) Transcript_3385:577-1572(-)